MSEHDETAPAESGKTAVGEAPRILAKDKQLARYNYTNEELLTFAQELAGTHRKIETIEANKKRANDQFKRELEAEADKVEDYSGRIREGYEMREYPCTTYADTPEKGMKSVVRDETGEVLRVIPMTFADLQQELPLAVRETEAEDEDEDEA